jgi:hypothetical protein
MKSASQRRKHGREAAIEKLHIAWVRAQLSDRHSPFGAPRPDPARLAKQRAAHWQSRWELLHGYQRVEQHDWMRPLRGDWIAQLEEVVLAAPGPVVLVAHSLGCSWSPPGPPIRATRASVRARCWWPRDVERDDLRQQLPGWAPVAQQAAAVSLDRGGQPDDPYAAFERRPPGLASGAAQFMDIGALRPHQCRLRPGRLARGPSAGCKT